MINYDVSANYVDSGEPDFPDFLDINRSSEHVCESQYLLQIIKCTKTDCFRARRRLFSLLNNRFLPPNRQLMTILDDGRQFLSSSPKYGN